MMLVAFRALLEGVETSFIVEEPESHLFPEAQERVLQLLVLVTRALRGSLLRTTHSPYIPFIMNRFAKAGEIGGGADRNAGLIDQAVSRDCWLSSGSNGVQCDYLFITVESRTAIYLEFKGGDSRQLTHAVEQIGTTERYVSSTTHLDRNAKSGVVVATRVTGAQSSVQKLKKEYSVNAVSCVL